MIPARPTKTIVVYRPANPATRLAQFYRNLEKTPKLGHIIFLAFLIYTSVHVDIFLHLEISDQIKRIPDDAFYYIITARNYVNLGYWSFDGATKASGFHILFGYFVALIDWALPGLAFVDLETIIDTMAALVVVVGVGLLRAKLPKHLTLSFSVATLYLFCGHAAADLDILLMESPFVILMACCFTALMIETPRSSKIGIILALAVGVAGVLCRTDFIGLPLAFAAAGVALMPIARIDSRAPILAAYTVAGATMGLSLIAVHTWLISGNLVQASVAMKAHWAKYYAYSAWPFLKILINAVFGVPFAWLKSLGLGDVTCASVLIYLGIWSGWAMVAPIRTVCRSRAISAQAFVMAGSAAAIVGYTIVYGFEPASILPWYLANAIVPLSVAIAGIVRAQPSPVRGIFVVVALAAATLVSLSPVSATWPDQGLTYRAATILRDEPGLAPVGAWNAGILSYFSGRDVVNLDGLVNDDILPYATADRLSDYIDKRGIRYIVDSRAMVETSKLKSRGGYPCGTLSRRLARQQLLPAGPNVTWRGSIPAIYRLLPGPPRYRSGDRIDFTDGGNASFFIGCGWGEPEPWGTSFDGTTADLTLPLAWSLRNPATLRIRFAGPTENSRPTRIVQIVVDGISFSERALGSGDVVTIPIPTDPVRNASIVTVLFKVTGDSTGRHPLGLGDLSITESER